MHRNAELELLACLKPFGDINDLTIIEIQRYVYLIQAFGVDLGYVFRWSDERGPFSDELTRIALDAVKSSHKDEAKLNEQAKSRVDACKAWIAHTLPKDTSIITWIGYLTCIHYLLHGEIRQDRDGLTKEQVFRDLVSRNPGAKHSKELFEAGWDALERVGLIKNSVTPRSNSAEEQIAMNEGAVVSKQEGTHGLKAHFHVRIEAQDSRIFYILHRKLELPFVPNPGLVIKSGDVKFRVKSIEWDLTQDLLDIWLDDMYVKNIDKLNETVQYLRSNGWL